MHSTRNGPVSCLIASAGRVYASLVKVPGASCVKGCTDRLRIGCRRGLGCVTSVVSKDNCGRLRMSFPMSNGGDHYVICSPRGSRVITLFISVARARRTRGTLSHDRGLLDVIFTGVPINVRVCSRGNFVVSVGGGSVRVFKIHSGTSILNIGMFSGPGVSRRVERQVHGRRGLSFHVGCAFADVQRCCRSREGKCVTLCAGIDGFFNGSNGFLKCVFLGVSGARRLSTVGGVRSFRGFFLLVSSCTGMNCTGLGLLSGRKCTVGR